MLGRRTAKPSHENLATAKQLCQYIASTKTEGLTLIKGGEKKIKVYVDASYGGEGARAQTGTIVLFHNSPILWNSRRQEVVSVSITEAEYIACAEAAKDARWIGQFLEEILPTRKFQPTIYTDNEAVLKLTKTQTFHRRTRHISHRFHFIRELVDNMHIKVQGIPGKHNPADLLTKLIPMSSVG